MDGCMDDGWWIDDGWTDGRTDGLIDTKRVQL